MSLNKKERLNKLLDFYQILLTKKQADVARLYYREDYSLAEISAHTKSSRSAIHDTLKRVEYVLENYEAQLHLVDAFEQRSALYTALRALHNDQVNALVDQLEQKE
jgi:predicted DNA-binding protein YlxM (UPF0122 family)